METGAFAGVVVGLGEVVDVFEERFSEAGDGGLDAALDEELAEDAEASGQESEGDDAGTGDGEAECGGAGRGSVEDLPDNPDHGEGRSALEDRDRDPGGEAGPFPAEDPDEGSPGTAWDCRRQRCHGGGPAVEAVFGEGVPGPRAGVRWWFGSRVALRSRSARC